jgi:hypothetical protein
MIVRSPPSSLEGTRIVNSQLSPGRRWSARSRRTALVALSVALLVMLVISIHWIRVISARYDDDTLVARDPATGGPSTGDPTPTSPSSASPSDPVDVPSQVGETRVGKNADTTLLQVRKIVAPAGREPSTGEEWFGIRAETCLHSDAPPSEGVGWSSWLVVDDTGAEHEGEDAPWDDFPPQQFPTTGLEPGSCNVGWILVGVPEGTATSIQSVVYRPNSPEPAEWAV